MHTDPDGDFILNNGLRGTLIGAVTQIASLITPGKALSIDTGQYVDFGAHPSSCLGNLDLCNDALTIALWINLETAFWTSIFTNNGGMRLQMDISGSDMEIHLRCVSAGVVGYRYSVEIGDLDGDIEDWNHYVFSCSKDNMGKVFVNGNLKTLDQTSSFYSDTSGQVILGKIDSNFDRLFLVDDLIIWYESVTEEMVAYLYNSYI